tara:strand:+ start:18413 stop:19318 length:906 start_codon:yes stop_codon:yes gene_type:complete
MTEYKNIGFYKFTRIKSPNLVRERFYLACKRLKILGTLILSEEGLNGMLAGVTGSIDKILPMIYELGVEVDDIKISFSEIKPFNRLRIKIKEEIISLGNAEKSNPNNEVGVYVDPIDWNEIIMKKDAVVIDTRNYYETSIGTFEKSLIPNINTFKEFPEFIEKSQISKDKDIAMFCTGGIRCEKASSYMLQLGFKNVYHLKGGIIKYLEDIPAEESRWEGECFVFDNRVAVEHELNIGSYVICNACGEPVNKSEFTSTKFRKGISCPSCFDSLTEKQIKKATERQKQVELAKERGKIHIGE